MTEAPPTKTSPDIYKQARERVLKDLPSWRRNEILRMEKENDTNNRYYTEFARNVIALAEDS